MATLTIIADGSATTLNLRSASARTRSALLDALASNGYAVEMTSRDEVVAIERPEVA